MFGTQLKQLNGVGEGKFSPPLMLTEATISVIQQVQVFLSSSAPLRINESYEPLKGEGKGAFTNTYKVYI